MLPGVSYIRRLSRYPGLEGDQFPLIRPIIYFDGVTADLAVLNVPLRPGRQVEQHGYPLTAMGAAEYPFPGCQFLVVQCFASCKLSVLRRSPDKFAGTIYIALLAVQFNMRQPFHEWISAIECGFDDHAAALVHITPLVS